MPRGDVVLADPEGNRVHLAGKIYRIAPNVAIGWSGYKSLANEAIARLRALGGYAASVESLDLALDDLEDLRGPGDPSLQLTGWIVTPAGAKVISWDSEYPTLRLCEQENAIGDGGDTLRRILGDRRVTGGNTTGRDVAPSNLISGFMEARFEETLRPNQWPTTWGAAYDAIIYQEGSFRWLDKVTYLGWNIFVDDAAERILDVQQAPHVFVQEHFDPYTVMFATKSGDTEWRIHVSYPVDVSEESIDYDYLRSQPHAVVSPYYANYFRFFNAAGHFVGNMALTMKYATRGGIMYHSGAHDLDARFEVNRAVFEPHVRDATRKPRDARS